MAERRETEIEGRLKIMGCCEFVWHEPENGGMRRIDIGPEHCERCVEELRRLSSRPLSLHDRRKPPGKVKVRR